MAVEDQSSDEEVRFDKDIVVSKEVMVEDLRNRIKAIVNKIKMNRNRPSFQSIQDHLKKVPQYREIDKDSDLIPFINTMVSDGLLRNNGKEKESFSVVSETSSGELVREVLIPRKRQRMEADLEYDNRHNNYKDCIIRKTKSMSEIPAKGPCSTIPDLTVSTNAGVEVEASVPVVQVEAIVDMDAEGNVFEDAEELSLVADIETSDRADVAKEVSPVLGGHDDGSDVPADGSDVPAGDKSPCQPNIVDISTPEHEVEPDIVEVLTQDIMNETNTSFQETHKSSIITTMEQYNAVVLDECTHCNGMESSVNTLVKEVQEKNDAIVELLEEQQLVLKHSEELKLQKEKLESVMMHTAARMRHLIAENKKKDQVVAELEGKIQHLYAR